MDMETGQEYQITDDPGSDMFPNWSPDGSKLVFQSDRDGKWQLYMLDLATKSITRLSNGSQTDVDPQFSPDGTKIAYRSYLPGSKKSMLYVMDLAKRASFPITTPDEDATNQAWSPSGKYIAYQSQHGGQLDIFVYDVANAKSKQITNSTVRDYAPVWLCGDDRLIFTSEPSSQPDLYEIEISKTQVTDVNKDATRMTFLNSDDIYPQNFPPKEFASREGEMGNNKLGQQTTFLFPDVNLTKPDLTIDEHQPNDWDKLNYCPDPNAK